MKQSASLAKLNKALAQASHVLIIQPENPDGDSLNSALALEELLGDMKIDTSLFCAVQIPKYLRYIEGWDRVSDVAIVNGDCCLILDTNKSALLSKTIERIGPLLRKIPVFVLDHHDETSDLPFDFDAIEKPLAATGELIYKIAQESSWPLSAHASELILASILFDTLGLVTETVTADTFRTVADLTERGASITRLEAARRETLKRDREITAYKGQLLQRIDYLSQDRIAYLIVPWPEIQQYSDRYNPAVLALDEMRLTIGVIVSVVFKTYPDSKITAKIRTADSWPIADRIAHQFGGGGHGYAAGFKLYDRGMDELLSQFVQAADDLMKETDHDTEAL